MTISIRDPECDRLARDLAKRSGKPITAVVKEALSSYARNADPASAAAKRAAIEELVEELSKRPILDPRSSQEIMDDLYDENGLPK